ncbi:MAG: 50S ribosomal protein L10 [bacterium]
MPNSKNQAAVAVLRKQVESAKGLFLADYSGLNLKAQRQLRRKVREAGGELIVTKNTLLKLVLKDNNVDVDKIAKELEGQNVTLFANNDVVMPLKALVEFAKEGDKPVLKAGLLGTEILSMAKVKQLASLPSKNELIAQLLRTLNNPARNLVSVLSAPVRDLVYALSAIGKKKGATV